MKISRIITCIMLVISVNSTFAQQQFKASQGLPTATSSAKTGGLPNAHLTAIATIGDTTFFGSYLPAIVKGLVKFDKTKGTSSFWGYRFRDTVAGKDTATAYIILKPTAAPFYLPVKADIPDIPNLPVNLNMTLPTTFMDSDTMCSRVLANGTYQSYMNSHPNAAFQAVALGMSDGSTIPIEGPLWIAFVGDNPNGDALTCFVDASSNNGQSGCITITAGVKDEGYDAESMCLYPNPLTGEEINLHIPLSLYMPQITVDVYSILGDKVKSYPLHSVGGGVDLKLDVHDLAAGQYYVRINDGHSTHIKVFSKD